MTKKNKKPCCKCPQLDCECFKDFKKKIEDKKEQLKSYVKENPQMTKKILVGIGVGFMAFLALIMKNSKNKNNDVDLD